MMTPICKNICDFAVTMLIAGVCLIAFFESGLALYVASMIPLD